MSNERSPREVCSMTIGIRGMGSLLAAGGPEFRLGRWFFLVRCPDRLAPGRDLLHLRAPPAARPSPRGGWGLGAANPPGGGFPPPRPGHGPAREGGARPGGP